jgi:hypothetical protein
VGTSVVPVLAQNLVTFTNPVTASQQFATSIALPRPELVLIGDPGDFNGKVFLFSTNGRLVRTYENPLPEEGQGMGESMAIVGPDHFVTGAPRTAGPVGTEPGAVHLFHLDGTLVRSFLDPAPKPRSSFGQSVAALGSDRVVISAPAYDGMSTGIVYIFRINGTLQTAITNPAPSPFSSFGYPVVVIGTNSVFIRSGEDSVYEYDANGEYVRTFQPPERLQAFGTSIAPLGKNRLVISGSVRTSPTSPERGAVYIFESDGTLLRFISSGTEFGFRGIATLGNRMILGLPDLQTATMYELCGNPIRGFVVPGSSQMSIATVGERDVLIGSPNSTGIGSATLFFRGWDRILTPMVESDYASGLDGWSSAPIDATYDPQSGVVFVREELNDGATNYWKAPPKFLANKSGAYNGQLRFEMKSSVPTSAAPTGEVILIGSGLTLIRNIAAPTGSFATYEVPLSAEGWRIGNAQSGVEPTEAQFLVALSGLTALQIRAEFSDTKPEQITLDNFKLLHPQAVCDTVLRIDRDVDDVKVEWAANALNFNLYRTTNLLGNNWTKVTSTPAQTNGVASVLESNVEGSVIYRLSRP